MPDMTSTLHAVGRVGCIMYGRVASLQEKNILRGAGIKASPLTNKGTCKRAEACLRVIIADTEEGENV